MRDGRGAPSRRKETIQPDDPQRGTGGSEALPEESVGRLRDSADGGDHVAQHRLATLLLEESGSGNGAVREA